MDQLIKKIVDSFPKEVALAIKTFPWVEKTINIAKKNNLDEIEKNSFFIETVILVLGVETPENYPENLAKNVGLNDEEVIKIAKEVDEEILVPIAKIMQEFETSTKQNLANEQNLKQRIGPKLNQEKKLMLIQWHEKFFRDYPAFSKNKAEKEEVARRIKSGVTQKIEGGFPDYYNGLPSLVKDLIFDGAWKSRTEEITKKYSLDPTQTGTLINNVLFVLIGIDKPEDFLQLMTSELGISRLLADQIIEDLEMRVFEYSLKTIEKATEKQELRNRNVEEDPLKQIAKPVLPVVEITKIPEIRPVNLPMVEGGEVAHDIEPKPEYKPSFVETVKPSAVENKQVSRITYSESKTSNEPIQRPVSVPRFMGADDKDSQIKTENKKAELEPIRAILKPDALNIINSKLIQYEETLSEPAPPKKVVAEAKPVKNYVVDPYREGLE